MKKKLSEPISDYYLDISNVNKGNVNPEFQEIIDIFQSEILQGNIEFDDYNKKIMYKQEIIFSKL